MLTFWRKYKKLKQIKGSWKCLGHFHRTRSQAFACAKMASAPKKPRQTLLSMFFFQKDNMNLKQWMYFFESAFEDLSFHSFLKARDWDFEEKNSCNKHRIWLILVLILIVLRPKYCLENSENSISRHLNLKIFWGGMPPDPPRKLAPSALEK